MQVAEFIVDCIDRAGGVAERRESDVIEALLPAALAAGCVEREVTLGLAPEALEREPRAELATIGSPFLDSLIAHAAAHGTASVGQLAPGRLRKKGLREEVERTLLFSGCRVRYDAGDPVVLRSYTVQFNFKVSFLTDERRERLYIVPVNLWSNQANLPLVEHLAAASPAGAPPDSLPDAARVPISDAYATAQRALRRLVVEEIARHQDRIRKRFGVEYLRIGDYYEQVARELESRRRDGDEGRARVLEAKLEAARAERQRKLHELGEKYHLCLSAKLTSARLLSQPKTFFRLLIDRGPTTRSLTLAYDSLLGRLEPPVCEACHEETTRVHVSQQVRFLCSACLGGGSVGRGSGLPRGGGARSQ
jgi:hypothetical protein